MIRGLVFLTLFSVFSSVAMAQDYGVSIGVHQTTAATDPSQQGGSLSGYNGSITGLLGLDLGFVAAFDLVPNLKFRTGLIYDMKPFQEKIPLSNGATSTVTFNFSYIDLPIDFQYNLNSMFGVFAGVVVGIKASDSVSSSYVPVVANMKALYPLVNAGMNFTFDNLYGFDAYYEYGLGDFADNVKNYSTFGLRFVYWF
jgi:hypothetical protein